MIFSNEVYKLSSGLNISLFSENANLISLYVFNRITHLKNVDKTKSFRCVNSGKSYNFNKIVKINKTHKAICFDNNISVIENE